MKNVKKIDILCHKTGRAGPIILKLSMKKIRCCQKKNLENEKIIAVEYEKSRGQEGEKKGEMETRRHGLVVVVAIPGSFTN